MWEIVKKQPAYMISKLMLPQQGTSQDSSAGKPKYRSLAEKLVLSSPEN
jgi:hypothetical protein